MIRPERDIRRMVPPTQLEKDLREAEPLSINASMTNTFQIFSLRLLFSRRDWANSRSGPATNGEDGDPRCFSVDPFVEMQS